MRWKQHDKVTKGAVQIRDALPPFKLRRRKKRRKGKNEWNLLITYRFTGSNGCLRLYQHCSGWDIGEYPSGLKKNRKRMLQLRKGYSHFSERAL